MEVVALWPLNITDTSSSSILSSLHPRVSHTVFPSTSLVLRTMTAIELSSSRLPSLLAASIPEEVAFAERARVSVSYTVGRDTERKEARNKRKCMEASSRSTSPDSQFAEIRGQSSLRFLK